MPTALLVEDDKDIAKLYQKLLWPWGLKTRLAGTVAAAMAIIQTDDPLDLACVDIGLPDGSGIDVVAALHARSGSLPVLVVTGTPEGLEERGLIVLAKPFTVAQFQIAVDNLVQAFRRNTPVPGEDRVVSNRR